MTQGPGGPTWRAVGAVALGAAIVVGFVGGVVAAVWLLLLR